MGNVKIRHYVTRRAWKGSTETWGYWAPTKKMKDAGFELKPLGPDGPIAWARAASWNAKWDAVRAQIKAGLKPNSRERHFPPGSLGEAFARYRQTSSWLKEKAERTREDWLRGWKQIEPVFGDVDPRTVALEDFDLFYFGDPNGDIKGILELLGVRESHRVVKIWRAMWKVISTINRDDGTRYCEAAGDPSFGIRRRNPTPRSVYWYEGEAVRLVKQAWRMNYKGLAAALAVSWDTMLSPVDVRSLTLSQLAPNPKGPLFHLERAKTGKAAIGTLSRRTERLLAAYIKSLPFTLHPETPIFHTRGAATTVQGGRPRPPVAYTKDTLGDDFRDVRAVVFPDDTRQIQDFRRSGAIETVAGTVDPAALAGKMANTIDSNAHLQATYTPHTVQIVRLADEARSRGRSIMREGNGGPNKT